MTTLDHLRQENPNSWYLKDRASRERKLAATDSGKIERMARAYMEAMGQRAPLSMDIEPPPAMSLQFSNVPLYSKGWKDLQSRIKKYKMQVTYKLVREDKWDKAYRIDVRPDARAAFNRDLEAGYVQTVTGWAK